MEKGPADRPPRKVSGGERPAAAWLPLVVMIAILAVTVGFQFRFQQGDVPRSQLTSRVDAGPWWGIKATPERHLLLDTFAADLRT